MKKFLLSLLCAFVALGANALTVVDIYKDFTTTQNISWGSDAANARISFSSTDGLVYSSTEATANNWDAQYWVANGNTFSPDNTYTLTMMIKGSVAGTIGNIKLGDWDQGVDNYGKFNIPAGEFKEVSIKVSGVPGGDGILLQTGSYVGTLCIKWIKVTHEETSDASKLCLALTDIPAGTNVWDNALQYAFDPALPAGDYTLSLDVKGDAAGSMNIWGEYVEGAYYGPVISFGTEWATKTMDFSLEKDFKLLRLVFGEYKGSSLYFDNIKITNKATSEEIVSADFSTGTLEGFGVAGFWTNDGGWVEHKANYEIVEAPEDSEEPDEPAWTVPEGEIDYTTLDGFKDVNNIGTPLNGGEVVYGDQSNGDNFTDVTDYDLVKFYGTPGALLRIFVNRVGSDDVTAGKTEQRVTIGEDGVGILNIKDVMTATEKNYCRISGIKIAASWQGATIEAGVVIKGITVVKLPETYTISTTAGKIGTIALDYPATIEGAELYEVVSFDAKEGLAIAEVEGDMVGGTPYIYLATADEVVCTKTGDAVEHGDFNCTKSSVGNGLKGCYEEVTPSTSWAGSIKDAYVISNGKLRQIANSDVTIPANRCFFDPTNCTNQSSSAKMVLAMEGATKINNVNAALEGGKIYDMNGREVQSMKKGGIYIVGGMKVSVK